MVQKLRVDRYERKSNILKTTWWIVTKLDYAVLTRFCISVLGQGPLYKMEGGEGEGRNKKNKIKQLDEK